MAPSQKPLRYAHADGHTDLCYSDDGRHMITCGSDGDARIWAGFEDDDPFSTVVGEKAFAVAFWGDRFYIGNDNNHVQAYSFQGKSRDGIVTRFTAPVTHIAVSRKGDTIVSGSCDMTIHVTDKETLKDRIFSGHKAPILGVAIDPKEKYLASSSCDGSVKIWSLLDGKDLKTWSNIIEPTNDFSFAKALGRAAWTPETGSYLAIPSGKSSGSGDRLHFQVILAERGTWNTMITLSDEHIKKPLSIAAFSPCGGYLAASAIGGELIIWDINSTKTIVKETHESGLPMTAMVWNPSGNGELAFCDNQGQLGLFENCIPQSADYSKPDDIGAPVDNEKGENASVLDNLDTLSNMMDDDDEDDENVISLEKIKSEVGFGVTSTSKEPETASVADEEDDLDKNMPLISGLPNFTKLQKPFQPTSTPVHLQQRFMVWNSVGMVRCYNTEEENSIDVEFHDSSIHHPLHIPNYLKHTMAALTKEALLLACEMDDETPSKLVCVLMNSWDGSKEWNMDMPEGEEVVAVGAGAGWAAVATNSYSLRFFTIGGCQREVMSIPGQVVCLTGHEHFLVVVFHGGIGVDGDQHLFYQVVKVGSRSAGGAGLLAHPPQPLPLSQKSTLSWVGFTDEGSVATQDSLGVIRLLFTARSDKGNGSNSSAGSWVPVCKTNSNLKNKYDHYFVLGVSEKYQNVRCVLCKGSHYPQTTPRPSVVEIPMQMPLCEAQTEKSLHEEKFWRAQLFSKNIEMISKVDESYMFEKDDLERTLKETVMKLFALACRGDLDFRAVELCKMMPSSQVVMLAEKYASKLGKQHLADRINTVVNQKVEEEEMQTRMTFHDSEDRNGYNGHRGLNSPLLFNTDDGANDYPGTPVEFTNTPASSGEAENILLSAKQRFSKLSNVVIKPSIKPEQNPFKKTPTSSNAKEKGLSRFSTPPMVNAKTSKQNGTPDSVAQLPKVKQTKLSGGKVDKPVAEKQEKTEKGAKKKMTYIQWFNKEKDALVDEFPDLSVAELTKVAMKRFKEWQIEMKKEESKCATDAESSEVQTPNGAAKTNGSTKDDADNADADKMTESIPETEMSESVIEGESESMAVDENAEMADEESSESMISTIKPQTKRKTAGDKFSNPEAKKAKNAGNASSKLSAFMFKKS